MEIKYKITNEDYQKLWKGEVKYIVRFYQKVEYGSRLGWIDYIKLKLRYLMGSYGHVSRRRLHSFQYYYINVYGPDYPDKLYWKKEDMDEFVKEKNLNIGDILFISVIHPYDTGGYWCACSTEFILLDDGWKKIRSLKGA